jgi:hypothetical protein
MSRNYDVQIEVFPCTAANRDAIADMLRRWGMAIDSDTESFDQEDNDGWSFWGSIQIGGGQTEEDRHLELRKLLPHISLTSRWRWVDDQPWDETFLSEPLIPAA